MHREVTVWGHCDKVAVIKEGRREASEETNPADPLISTFKTARGKRLLLKLQCAVWLERWAEITIATIFPLSFSLFLSSVVWCSWFPRALTDSHSRVCLEPLLEETACRRDIWSRPPTSLMPSLCSALASCSPKLSPQPLAS